MKNSSLFQDYPGLKPNNYIINWIFAMASRDPDTTIAVRAANEYSISKTNFAVRMNPELVYINKFKGVADLKFCYYYFPGIVSDKINNTFGLANYKQTSDICMYDYELIHARSKMMFQSDSHVLGFLNLFKKGKYISKCFFT